MRPHPSKLTAKSPSPQAPPRGVHCIHGWSRFLASRHAVWLTHGSLLSLTAAYFALLLNVPFWLACWPGVLLGHRIGILLHEYIHGIPFRGYQSCLRVLTVFDGLLLMFGSLELFRGTHLSHHAWLNDRGDSAFHEARLKPSSNRWLALLASLELVQHLKFLWQSFRGLHPFVRGRRMSLGAGLSLVMMAFWISLGRPDIIWKLMAITLITTAVPVTLRGAVEHHSHPGDPGFANEYRVLLPLFNLNRHIHHHENPRCPWYRLEFRTPTPLSQRHYLTHWFHAQVRRDYVLMQPVPGRRPAPPELPPTSHPTAGNVLRGTYPSDSRS